MPSIEAEARVGFVVTFVVACKCTGLLRTKKDGSRHFCVGCSI
jgi:hypothetical protein